MAIAHRLGFPHRDCIISNNTRGVGVHGSSMHSQPSPRVPTRFRIWWGKGPPKTWCYCFVSTISIHPPIECGAVASGSFIIFSLASLILSSFLMLFSYQPQSVSPPATTHNEKAGNVRCQRPNQACLLSSPSNTFNTQHWPFGFFELRATSALSAAP